MDWKKKQELLSREMPHLKLAGSPFEDEEGFAADIEPGEVDARSPSLSTWDKFDIADDDAPPTPLRQSRPREEPDLAVDLAALRELFQPRILTGQGPARAAVTEPSGTRGSNSRLGGLKHGQTEITPARLREATDDSEVKDVVLDEEEGIIGAQG